MARIMEIFVIVNAACGIAAFLIAKGLLNKGRRKANEIFRGEDEESRKELMR